MSADVLCFCSANGGTGKTSVAASLALLYSELGKQVLLIDADAASSGLTLLMLRRLAAAKGQRQDGVGLFEDGELTPVSLSDNLQLIPAFGRLPDHVVPHQARDYATEHIFGSLPTQSSNFNIVIVDTEAGVEPTSLAAVQIAQTAVIVTEFDPMPAVGVRRLEQGFCARLAKPDIHSREQTFARIGED